MPAFKEHPDYIGRQRSQLIKMIESEKAKVKVLREALEASLAWMDARRASLARDLELPCDTIFGCELIMQGALAEVEKLK